MKEIEFFQYYIPALEKAIWFSNNHNEVYTYDHFINNNELINQMDLFEDENYLKFQKLFDMVAYYFDAMFHNFEAIEGINIDEYRLLIEIELLKYRDIYNVS